MRKRSQFLLAMAVFTISVAACRGPLIGIVTETYVNQGDVRQALELTAKETVKGLMAGRSPNPAGIYTLLNEQGVTTGEYTRIENMYVLQSNENHEFKFALQQDSSLRDENGNVWRLQSRSRSFRGLDDTSAPRQHV